MLLPMFLAHGALGNFDEVIFLLVAGIFLTMMGISWVKSRNTLLPIEEELTHPAVDSPETDNASHFKLD